ncbi:Bcr/CflA family efflux MFS transporter [Rhodobacteraceae bacterium W635]|nr:Bcr/CflA family efflux MFS transporter [Rhodobacteraceae bacterium W635]
MHMFVPALPFAASTLGVGSQESQLILTVYILGLAVGQPIYGPIADAFGRRPVVIAAMTLYALGTLASIMAASLPTLLSGRLLQALGGAGGITLARAIVRDVSGPDGSQKDISLLNLIMLTAPAISPVIGAWIAADGSWRGIFVFLLVLATAVLLLSLQLLPETARHRKRLTFRTLLEDFRRLAMKRQFICIAAGGALGSTATYGYFAAAPYILTGQMDVPPSNVGYFVGGILLGAISGTLVSRLRVGHMSQNSFLRFGGLLAVAVSGTFLGTALTGVLAPGLLFVLTFVLMFAAGCISATALAASLDSVPDLAGSAAGFFGAAQMVFGALSTFLVSFGDQPDLSCALTLFAAAILSLTLLHLGQLRG